MDYRNRFYTNYLTSHVAFDEKITLESFAIVAKSFQNHIAQYIPKDTNASILDVACGPGHLLHFLQKQGYHNSRGIDLGIEQLNTAVKMGVQNVEQADLFKFLKTHMEQFDVILAFHIIEHLTKPEALQAVDLIFGALKAEGKVLVATPNTFSFAGLYATFGDFTHELAFTPKSLAQLLRICGFSNVNVSGLGPVAYDLRSAVRTTLWKILKAFYKVCFTIERGTGRSIWQDRPIFEKAILAVGHKKV